MTTDTFFFSVTEKIITIDIVSYKMCQNLRLLQTAIALRAFLSKFFPITATQVILNLNDMIENLENNFNFNYQQLVKLGVPKDALKDLEKYCKKYKKDSPFPGIK